MEFASVHCNSKKWFNPVKDGEEKFMETFYGSETTEGNRGFPKSDYFESLAYELAKDYESRNTEDNSGGAGHPKQRGPRVCEKTRTFAPLKRRQRMVFGT